ncbi:MAG TPA: hypothetical protein VGC34_08405, partial [Steroidobacteraceae bacterium]
MLQDSQAKIETLELLVNGTQPGTAEWFETCLRLAALRVESVGLAAVRPEADVIRRSLERAIELAKEVMRAADRTPWGQRRREAGAQIASLAAEGLAYLNGDREGLQAALAYADAVPPSAGTDLEASLRDLGLSVSLFEQSGKVEDLDRGIELGERVVSALNQQQGDHAAEWLRNARQYLSMHLGFRALHGLSAKRPGEALEATRIADCERAVQLARAASQGPQRNPLQEALAARSLGLALRAQSILNNDPELRVAAIQSFLRAMQLVGEDSPPGQHFANNAATAMGELAEPRPDLRINPHTTVLDDAISLLQRMLAKAATDPTRDGRELLEQKFNLARLVVIRFARDSAAPGDLPHARAAITDCTTWLMSGHQQRAPALAIAAEVALAEFFCDRNPRHLTVALEAILEADAILASGAPLAALAAGRVHHIIETWRRYGGSEVELLDGSVRATRKLVEALAEYAVPLANQRARAALGRGDTDRAAEYAEILALALARALIVADDLDLAYRLAEKYAVTSSLAHVAVEIAVRQPDRAVMLLERAQANSIGRLQLSLGSVGSAQTPNDPAVARYLAARAQLRQVTKARMAGRMSATDQALRTADEELEAAIRSVRGLPGMSQFLVQIE